MGTKIDLTDKVFGHLLVLNEVPNRASDGSVQWRCLCSCGKTTVASANNIKRGITQSCGCLQVQQQKFGSITHGHSCGGALTPTYAAWNNMIARCTNPKDQSYEHYGARGISVCQYWMKFENFLQDMGEKPEGLVLDRKNNNGNYEPGNCRWVTYSVSNQNRRPFNSGAIN